MSKIKTDVLMIVFHTVDPRPPEIFYMNNSEDVIKYSKRLVEITKARCKFAIYTIGACIGDYS